MADERPPDFVQILLVDESAEDRALVERELLQGIPNARFEHIATSGDLASALAHGAFDLVITEYRLSWGGGLSVLLAVKELDADLPVVMYTGPGGEEIAAEVMRAGVDACILKSPEHRVRLTAAVRAALARAQERRKLREAEALYQSLFEDSQAPMLVVDPANELVVDANPAACAFYGWTRRELIGKPASALSASPREEYLDHIRGVLERGERYLQAAHRLASGEIRNVEIYVGTMTVRGRNLQYGIIHDITARVQAGEDLRRRDEVLEALAFAVEQLLKARDWREVIPAVLERLGRSVGVSRAYLFESHLNRKGEPVISQRSEWVADGVSAQIDNPLTHEIPQLHGPLVRWLRSLRREEAFFGAVREFPEEEREMLRGQDIQSIALVPIISEGALWGLLGFDDCWTEREWAAGEIEALRLAAGTLGAAIRRRRSEDVMARRAKELSALYQTSLEITSRVHLPELLEIIVRRAADLVGAPMGALYLMEPDRKRLRLVVSHNLPGDYLGVRLKIGEGLSGRVAESGETLVVEDYQGWNGRAEIYKVSPFSRVLGVPLKRGGQVIGVINVTDTETVGAYDPEDVRLISLLADQAAIAIENSRLLEETERRAQEMDALYHTSLDITSRVGLPELLETVVRRAANLIGASMGGLYLTEESGKTLQCVVSHNLPPEYVGNRLALGEGLAGLVAERGEPIVVEDYQSWEGRAAIYTKSPFRRVLGVPLKRGGQVIGVIDVVDTDRVGPYDPEDVRLITLLADQAAIAVENGRLLEETQRRATYLEAITSTSRALRAARTRKDMLPIILDQLLALTGAGGSVIGLLEGEDELVTELGRGSWSEVTGQRQPADAGVMGHVVTTRKSLVLHDARKDDRLLHPQSLAGQNAMALVPLLVEDRVIGVVGIGRQTPFNDDEIRILNAIAEMAATAINRAGITESLEQRVRERTSALEVSNERLKELDRLKSDFVSNVSHELRTPISNIILYLDLLDQPARADRQPAYLGILKGEAEKLRSLIEDLLTLSRIERGAIPLELEPHSLDPLIAEVVVAHSARALAKQVRLTHEPSPRLPVVWVSRAEMQRVFSNLLGNAVAYSPTGGAVEARAEERDHRGSPYVTVAFHNSGPPIEEGDMAHLFERFYRGQNARLYGEPGTGLGLAISKEIVERHRGWIEVVSLEGAGTTFTVWLPVRPAERA
jgi:PAS domain S-box-containing protein